MSILFRGREKNVDRQALHDCLTQLGVGAGETLMVHSSLLRLGRPEKGLTKPELLGPFVETLLELVGPQGGLVFPTFTFADYCRNGRFDVRSSPSRMGVLSEYVRGMPDAQRTRNPLYSVALLGGARQWLDSSVSTAFGAGSIFDRLKSSQETVKFLSLGVALPPAVFTYIHHLEEQAGVPYRYHKSFPGVIRDQEEESQNSCEFFVRQLDPPVYLDCRKMWQMWRAEGLGSTQALGDSLAYCIGLKELEESVLGALQEDPKVFCSSDPQASRAPD